MGKKFIMGVDPSMRSTGVCVWDGSDYKYFIVAANPTKKLLKFAHPAFGVLPYEQVPVKDKTSIGKESAITDNIASVCGAIEKLILIYKPKRVVMEACAFAAGGRVADLSGLNHCLRQLIRRHGIPVYVVPPTSNKLEFTGNGQATKEMMVEAWIACDHTANELLEAGKVDDLADAFALCRYPESKLILE
ncbi:MAG: hypothetical protein K2N48_04805 [Muribaculaceae bacterium]|nr:hypothetical protein [Muribaculaceae bacterium]